MATYVIGDIHGCWRTLEALLVRIDYSPDRDRLWLVGDLVNGGPNSLEVLRWAWANQDNLTAVLGNHDVYFLGRMLDVCSRKKRDTLDELLQAPDRDVLADWLRGRPLIHAEGKMAMVHGGLLPQWTFGQANELAAEVEAVLRGSEVRSLLQTSYSKNREWWKPDLEGFERLSTTLQFLTMLRTCRADGTVCREFSGPPESAPNGCLPWYQQRPVGSPEPIWYFGHWAALGFRKLPGAFGLDSGCGWGNPLTAVRLSDGAVFQQTNLDL